MMACRQVRPTGQARRNRGRPAPTSSPSALRPLFSNTAATSPRRPLPLMPCNQLTSAACTQGHLAKGIPTRGAGAAGAPAWPNAPADECI